MNSPSFSPSSLQPLSASPFSSSVPAPLPPKPPASSMGMKLLLHRFAEMLSTHRDRALVAADLDLRSFFDRVPLLISAEIHGGLGATEANRLELGESVGPSEQGGTAGEEVPLKVGPESVAKQRDIQIGGDLSQFLELICQAYYGPGSGREKSPGRALGLRVIVDHRASAHYDKSL
jgi:hypothetical protein